MDTFLEAFGKKLKALREKAEYTQEQLAELIGVDIRHICRLESGSSFTKYPVIVSYCRVLGVTPAELFDFEYDNELSMLATGTYGTTYLKVVATEAKTYVKSASKDINVKELNNYAITEEVLLKMSKEMKRDIIVDWVDENERKCVYRITPEGLKITIYTPDEVKKSQFLNDVTEKLKALNIGSKQFKFINLAIDALTDKKARNDLKQIIEGMEMLS